MAPNSMQRPKFFEEQYLSAEDLTAAVDYARAQHARHALGAHTWGIAVGLQLREIPLPGDRVDIYLLPGYAWDGYGRPIVVLSPYRIPEEKFAQFTTPPEGQLIPIWLRYDEKEASFSKASTVYCDVASSASRIQETFVVEVGNRSANELTSGVNLAGRALADPKAFLREFDPAAPLVQDASVPHQSFPDSYTRARWLIPVGFVRWLQLPGGTGHFLRRVDSGFETDSDKIRSARRYIGVVTEEIEAADGAIRLRNRTDDPAKSVFHPPSAAQAVNDLVWVEGNLRTQGDNRICGGSLDFRDSAGHDFDVPMRVQRNDAAGGDRALRVLIGPVTQPTTRFAVGVTEGDNFQDRFVVTSGGSVGIGTSNPTDLLHVLGDLRITGLARKPDGGGWTFASDERLKQNVEPLSGALDLLLRLRGTRFEWKDPARAEHLPGPQFGLVAQEVEKVFPEWVSKDANGFQELTLRGFEALVIEALRELKTQVEELRSIVDSKETPTPRKKSAPRKAKASTKA
jgi:Chaperone of endosialidase